MTTITDTNIAEEMQLRAMLIERIGGFMTAHAIGLAAELGLADHIGNGTVTSQELATATGTHQPSLARLLRMMVAVGLTTEPAPDQFGLTAVGAQLRSDSAHSLRSFARMFCHPALFAAWSGLKGTITTGEAAFDRINGAEFYAYLSNDPQLSVLFNDAMGEESRSSAAHLAASYDFTGFTTVVDLGGGDGTLLAAILRRHPHLRGIVFDTESGVAEAPAVLTAAGVDDRGAVRAGSFFGEIPAGADLYLIKSVFQDWADEQALEILRSCRAQMPADATLLIVGSVVPDLATTAEPIIFFTDMNMLVNAGGRERTEGEFRALLDAAGFRVQSVRRGGAGPLSIITATPAAG
jgi:hypothetical protein